MWQEIQPCYAKNARFLLTCPCLNIQLCRGLDEDVHLLTSSPLDSIRHTADDPLKTRGWVARCCRFLKVSSSRASIDRVEATVRLVITSLSSGSILLVKVPEIHHHRDGSDKVGKTCLSGACEIRTNCRDGRLLKRLPTNIISHLYTIWQSH